MAWRRGTCIHVAEALKALALAGQLNEFNKFIRRCCRDPDCNPEMFGMIQSALEEKESL